MTDDLKERLLTWHPAQAEEAGEAVARITDLEEARDSWMRACNLALQEKLVAEARLAAAEAGEDALAKQAIRVMASLAAAISLLGRGGKAAKKAAPSDKIFDQMLKDYQESLESGRVTLAAYEARRKG